MHNLANHIEIEMKQMKPIGILSHAIFYQKDFLLSCKTRHMLFNRVLPRFVVFLILRLNS